MKIGFRIPSLKKRLSARTSLKRYVRHSLGVKAPRGYGVVTNPKRAAYNWVYRRTTVGIEDLAPKKRRKKVMQVPEAKPQRKGFWRWLFGR